MKILITGGFGYLGSYCAEFLYNNGFEVSLLGRKIPEKMKKWSEKFNVILGDISNKNIIDKLSDKKFDYVIHFAGVKNPFCIGKDKLALEINALGTKNILESCKKIGVKKFIYISSFHIYGRINKHCNITEETEPNPLNDYGITKYFGELYCKQCSQISNIDFVILRLSNICSKPLFNFTDAWIPVPNNFVKQIFDDKRIVINSSGEQIRNFISITDLCNAVILSINKKLSNFEVFNVGSDYNFTINEIANLTIKTYKDILHYENIKIIHNNKTHHNDVIPYMYDICKLKSIGYKPLNNIEEEIKKTIKSYNKI